MKNKKIMYSWCRNYDEGKQNNGFDEETEYIVTDGVYDLGDFLYDNGILFENDGDFYWVIDNEGKRTGEVYRK